MNALQRQIVRDHQRQTGAHDSPAVFGEPAGDPGLIGPGSMSWEIHSDVAAITIGGLSAIVMEILHPSVMAGVQEQSSYQEDPLRRGRTTFGYVVTTTFASTPSATRLINAVKSMHGRVNGTRPDGVPYRALDPELIGWVHTCIPWAVMTAYDRYRRPLTPLEKDRYLREQAVIGRMGGAGPVPESMAELDDYLHEIRGRLAVTQQTVEFIEFLTGRSGDYPTNAWDRTDLWLTLAESMSLMPRWARQLTGTDHGELFRRTVLEPRMRTKAAYVRWLYPELPCIGLARARATADAVVVHAA